MRKWNFHPLFRGQNPEIVSAEAVSGGEGIVSSPAAVPTARRSCGAYRTVINHHRAVSERIDKAEETAPREENPQG